MFSDIDWDVAEMTKDMIDDSWQENRPSREDGDPVPNPVEKPPQITFKTQTNDGRYRGRVNRGTDYIICSESGDRDMENADIFWESQTYHATANVEFSTAKGRERLEGMFNEIAEIAIEHRKRPETPGGWDNVMVNGHKYNDENFNIWVGTMTFRYQRLMDVIG